MALKFMRGACPPRTVKRHLFFRMKVIKTELLSLVLALALAFALSDARSRGRLSRQHKGERPGWAFAAQQAQARRAAVVRVVDVRSLRGGLGNLDEVRRGLAFPKRHAPLHAPLGDDEWPEFIDWI